MRYLLLLLALLGLSALPARTGEPPVRADVVIRGAMIHDGSGGPGRVGDVAIRGDKVVAVGKFQVAGALIQATLVSGRATGTEPASSPFERRLRFRPGCAGRHRRQRGRSDRRRRHPALRR